MNLFENWYLHYPKKKSKAHARKAFERINPDEPMTELMIMAIQLQMKEMEVRKQRGLFIPEWKYPATWLNGECWDDEVDLDVLPEVSRKLNDSDIIKLGKELNLPARTGESMPDYKQRLQRTRH